MVVAAVLLVALVTLARRVQFAVDYTDEAFYTALPFRFVLGDRPFVDEIFPSQTAALVTYPVVWLYFKIAGGTKGIVLFMRLVYVAFTALVGATVYAALRRRFTRGAALLAGLLPAVAVPFCIPSPSYNTLGAGFWTMALFAAVGAGGAPRARSWRALSGVTAALAVLCYPPFGPCAGLVLLLHAVRTRDPLRTVVLPWLAGAGVVALAVLPVVLQAGIPTVLRPFTLGHGLALRGSAKVTQLLTDWVTVVPYLAGVALPLHVAAFAWLRGHARWAPVVLPVWVVSLLVITRFDPVAATLWTTISLGLAAPLVALASSERPPWDLVLDIWLPALLAGVISAYTSTNAGPNGGIGLLPAAVVTVALLVTAVERGLAAAPAREAAGAATGGLVILATAWHLMNASYREHPFAELTARVKVGPYAGLLTTPAKAAFVTALHRDLSAVTRPERRLVAYFDFPAAYLSTPMRGGAPSPWVFSTTLLEETYEGVQRLLPSGAIALKMREYPGRRVPPTANTGLPLARLIESSGRVLRDRPEYVIYDLPPAPR